jgi:rRNA small subunit pseudouridine methyltransferase Nep1
MALLSVLLAESSLETVPEELWNAPEIVKDAKKRNKHPSKILLDSSRHHRAMRYLENREKRGRPDVIHSTLLLLLDSLASRNNFLEVYIHTLQDLMIYVNPITRLPRNYNRFVGLMEDLLCKKEIVSEDTTLLKLLNCSVEDILSDPVIVMTSTGYGTIKDMQRIFRKNIENNVKTWVIIGGFPHGEFKRDFHGFPISLGSTSLSALYTASKVLCVFEEMTL